MVTEGETAKYIYFIEEGEFEMTKSIYVKNERGSIFGEYLRFSSDKNVYYPASVVTFMPHP
jgi:CRP-like cAMP-binding protein